MGKKSQGIKLTRPELLHYWQKALKIWSPYVRLQHPIFCIDMIEEQKESLSGSFAMIRLSDLRVVISLKQIESFKLEKFILEILAHEIGHHVYCPADLADFARLLARMRRALPTMEKQASFIGNLYTDLLINDRLFRQYNLPMDKIYKRVNQPTKNLLWNLYMRTYEILWSLPRKTFTHIPLTEEMEADALLCNRLIRNYSRDWLKGSGAFAAICLTYLLKEPATSSEQNVRVWLDTVGAAKGGEMPIGISSIDDDEITGARHPATIENREKMDLPENGVTAETGNFREPFEYLEVIKSMGVSLTETEIISQYYRERALPHLIPFPQKNMPGSKEPLPEGLETWDVGDPLEHINWLETVIRSPVVVPGLTTIERVYGETEGSEPEKAPIDLDLYVDCSGSMPNPTQNISYLTLAAAIISLSALRSGSAVQATLWSGVHQFITTDGFVRDQKEIMRVMTGFFGGGTAFPLHILRKTYEHRRETDRKVHILVISDEGVDTILQNDDLGNPGSKILATALEKAGAGATLVLNLFNDNWKNNPPLMTLMDMGIEITRIINWEDLTDFSRDFSRKQFGDSHD